MRALRKKRALSDMKLLEDEFAKSTQLTKVPGTNISLALPALRAPQAVSLLEFAELAMRVTFVKLLTPFAEHLNGLAELARRLPFITIGSCPVLAVAVCCFRADRQRSIPPPPPTAR